MNKLKNLKEIFEKRIFKIPDYQRGYAWQEKQLMDFWEDLVDLPKDKIHYTGVLSLERVSEVDYSAKRSPWNGDIWLIKRDYEPFYIVDGQQRITTSIILIRVIYEYLEKINNGEFFLGGMSLQEIKKHYLIYKEGVNSSCMFGYEIDDPSFEFLKYKIFSEPGGGQIDETFYTLNLEKAKIFFSEKINQYYQDYHLEGIKSLFEKLTCKFLYNEYEMSNEINIFVAFETMNNRGKKLSNLELLKNRLIYLTTLYPESDTLEPLRDEINDAWKEIYHFLGKNKNSPLDDDEFLKAHWILYFPYTRKEGNDYISFLLDKKFTLKSMYTQPKDNSFTTREGEIFEQLSPLDIKNYILSLKSAVKHWYNSFNPINNKDLNGEAVWLDRLNRIGIKYFRPLVVASFINEKITSEERIKLFKEIERFIFIVFRLGRSMSHYGDSEFYRTARLLIRNERTVEQIIDDLHTRLVDFINDGVIEHKYFKEFLNKKFNGDGKCGFYKWDGLRYFLYEYEISKFNERGNPKVNWTDLFKRNERDQVSVEHIYPQKPDAFYWIEKFEGVDEEKKIYLQGSLGNLLLLSQSINSSLQNDPFPEKKNGKREGERIIRHGYVNGSHSEIEVATRYSDWTPNEILERGMGLLNFMEKRWEFKFKDENAKLELLFLDFLKT